MRFEALFQDWQHKKLTQQEAALILGISERTFRRYCRSFEANGAEGLFDDRLNKKAHNAVPVDEMMEVLELFETRYPTFTTAHFYDQYRDFHGGTRSYSWVKKALQDAGFVKKAKKRGAHRRKRPRAPRAGMMIHQDGSTHEWVPDQIWDLIVTMDDATNEVYSGFFVAQEGTHSSFRGVQEVIQNHGLFCSFYSDRGSHYWLTKKAGDKVDKHNLTQFGRAMLQLGIEMIPAYSPQARGRSERLFRTLQQRLTKELALDNINTMEQANQFLKDVFWPRFNAKFSVKPKDEQTAFIPYFDAPRALKDILCIQEQRTVNKDNTIQYKALTLQIPKQTYRCHFIKARVKVHEYHDRSLAIFHGPRCLARYDQLGYLIDETLNTQLKAA